MLVVAEPVDHTRVKTIAESLCVNNFNSGKSRNNGGHLPMIGMIILGSVDLRVAVAVTVAEVCLPA